MSAQDIEEAAENVQLTDEKTGGESKKEVVAQLREDEADTDRRRQQLQLDSRPLEAPLAAASPSVLHSFLGNEAEGPKKLTTWQNIRKYALRFITIFCALQNYLFPLRAFRTLVKLALIAGIWTTNNFYDGNGEDPLGADLDVTIPNEIIIISALILVIPTLASWGLNTLLSWSKAAEDIAAVGVDLPDNRFGKAVMITSLIFWCILPAITFDLLCASPIVGEDTCLPPLNNRTAGYSEMFDTVNRLSNWGLGPDPFYLRRFATLITCSILTATNAYQFTYAAIMTMVCSFTNMGLTRTDQKKILSILESTRFLKIPYLRRLFKTREVLRNQNAGPRNDKRTFKHIGLAIQRVPTLRDAALDFSSRINDILFYGILLTGMITVCDFISESLEFMGEAYYPIMATVVGAFTLAFMEVLTSPASAAYQTWQYALQAKTNHGCRKQKGAQEGYDDDIDAMEKEERAKVCCNWLSVLTVAAAVVNTLAVAAALQANPTITTIMAIIAILNTMLFNALGGPRNMKAVEQFKKTPPWSPVDPNAELPKLLPSEFAQRTVDIANNSIRRGTDLLDRIKMHAADKWITFGSTLAWLFVAASGYAETGNRYEEVRTETNETLFCYGDPENLNVSMTFNKTNTDLVCDWATNSTCPEVDHSKSLWYGFLTTYVAGVTLARLLFNNNKFMGFSFKQNIVYSLMELVMAIPGIVFMQLIASLASNGGFGPMPIEGLTGDLNIWLLGFLLIYTAIGFTSSAFPLMLFIHCFPKLKTFLFPEADNTAARATTQITGVEEDTADALDNAEGGAAAAESKTGGSQRWQIWQADPAKMGGTERDHGRSGGGRPKSLNLLRTFNTTDRLREPLMTAAQQRL